MAAHFYRGLHGIKTDLAGQPILKGDPQGTRKRLAVIAAQILRVMMFASIIIYITYSTHTVA